MNIEELKARWEEAAAKGDHATCYSIKQEIEALEHQAAVDAVQRKAKAEAARIAEAVEDAAATLRAIENHHGIRADYGKLLADLEAATGRVVDLLANICLFGGSAQGFPASGFRHPEHIDGGVVVAVFEFVGQQRRIVEEILVRRIGKAGGEFSPPRGEGIGNVLEENQP